MDTLAPLLKLPGAAERPTDFPLDDLLIAWADWSADPAAVAALGEISPDLDARIAALAARLQAMLPTSEGAALDELLALQRQRADEWGFSGVEFARRALVELLR